MGSARELAVLVIARTEVGRALRLELGPDSPALEQLRMEWSALTVLALDEDLAERAVELAVEHSLRSLDALHLAAALSLPGRPPTLATWDRRLHRAAVDAGLEVIPGRL